MASKSKKNEMLSTKGPAPDPPPPYELSGRDMSDSTDSDSDSDFEQINAVPSTGGLTLPGVIPQVTKAHRGAFFSPFARAWIPELEVHGISRDDFVTYIDGLNEAFVAHPIFQGLGIAGGVLQMAYGVQPAQYAGVGLQVAAGAASAATSYARTRAYVKATNRDLFHPAGLHVNVLTTKKMLAKVGFPEEKMQLPPIETEGDLLKDGMKPKEAARVAAEETADQNDPRMRRLEALKGYVSPFDMNVPVQIDPQNFFKRLSAHQAAKMEKKQSRKAVRRQERQFKGQARMERLESRKETRESRHEHGLADLDDKLEKQLSLTDDPRGQEQLRREYEKERSRLERRHEKRGVKTERRMAKRARKNDKRSAKLEKKENKIAHKIRWLVISRWERNVDSDEGSIDSSDDEQE